MAMRKAGLRYIEAQLYMRYYEIVIRNITISRGAHANRISVTRRPHIPAEKAILQNWYIKLTRYMRDSIGWKTRPSLAVDVGLV